jgi:hypothetical protein
MTKQASVLFLLCIVSLQSVQAQKPVQQRPVEERTQHLSAYMRHAGLTYVENIEKVPEWNLDVSRDEIIGEHLAQMDRQAAILKALKDRIEIDLTTESDRNFLVMLDTVRSLAMSFSVQEVAHMQEPQKDPINEKGKTARRTYFACDGAVRAAIKAGIYTWKELEDACEDKHTGEVKIVAPK